MPVYIYQCECGESTEVLHSMTATVRIVCDECLKEMTRRPSVAGVSFKGAGWGKDA